MDGAALDSLLDALARDQGDPGGGAASGIMTAISAALAQMVCRYTRDAPETDAIDRRLGELRERAVTAAERDARASGALGVALRPAGAEGSDERSARIVAAGATAVGTSARLGAVSLAVWHELERVAAVGNRHLLADVAVAADAVAAGLGGAVTNLRGGLTLVAAHGDASALDAAHGAMVDELLTARSAARALADGAGEP
ncbi:cyclodeaminase/cyclohydrolase family protein [Microbacterium oleivorans]|uniref:Cyclodeaminase/cyclohydrolase family protein n=1 Tax=Microbacterium oleivorans TaxID=273677 RepID=A0A7D5EWR4_9MICO|nr:cyclodeaminase/cyclohydrolase family protein [Microbacterium oleivorans]QLD12872.1 cyclodeaminase/cyclohydrolase family protein [Microbacterium oleivorans]